MMRIISIAWNVLVNIATLAIILALFQVAKTTFETVVIGALVLIYVGQNSTFTGLGYAQSRKWQLDTTRYIAIARALKLNTEIEEEAQAEDLADDNKAIPKFWLKIGFNYLFGLIATVEIIIAVVRSF